jgi:hypothetical protein
MFEYIKVAGIRKRNRKTEKIQWPEEKGQATIFKTLHQKLSIEQHVPH